MGLYKPSLTVLDSIHQSVWVHTRVCVCVCVERGLVLGFKGERTEVIHLNPRPWLSGERVMGYLV